MEAPSMEARPECEEFDRIDRREGTPALQFYK
jgi:hypothetical protein